LESNFFKNQQNKELQLVYNYMKNDVEFEEYREKGKDRVDYIV